MNYLTLTEPRDERNAWGVWLALLIVSVGIALRSETTVSKQYSRAARHWLESEPLYNGGGSGFIYLPQAAILHIPFVLLPQIVGEILWRLLTIGVYAFGLRRLCGLSEQAHRIRLFPLATCIAVPLVFSAARNGQTTPLIAGLVMLAIGDVVKARWGSSAALLCLAFAFKPVALPFLLLIGALYPPMRMRLIAGMLAVVAAPYFVQSPHYVTSQYMAWRESMNAVVQLERKIPFAHFFRMLELAGWAVPMFVQTIARLVFALALLGAFLIARRQFTRERYAIFLFTLTTGYVLLLNPRSENNGYAFLSPAIGLFLAEAFLVDGNWRRGAGLSAIALGMLGGYEVALLIAPQTPPIWLTPLMAIAFLTVAGRQFLNGLGNCGTGISAFSDPILPVPKT